MGVGAAVPSRSTSAGPSTHLSAPPTRRLKVKGLTGSLGHGATGTLFPGRGWSRGLGWLAKPRFALFSHVSGLLSVDRGCRRPDGDWRMIEIATGLASASSTLSLRPRYLCTYLTGTSRATRPSTSAESARTTPPDLSVRRSRIPVVPSIPECLMFRETAMDDGGGMMATAE